MRIDGEPRLPAHYWLWHNVEPPLRFVRESPERGEVEFERVSGDPGPVTLQMWGQGFQRIEKTVELSPGNEPTVVEFDLQPAFTLIATVSGDAGLEPDLFAKQWLAGRGEWEDAYTVPGDVNRLNSAGGTYRFEGLGTGRYRVEEGNSGQVSEEVELDASRPVGHVHLDLARPYEIKGLVRGPDGLDTKLVQG